MLELVPRPDLIRLDDAALADRPDQAIEGLRNTKAPFWPVVADIFGVVGSEKDCSRPSRLLVSSHITGEIGDLLAEVARRRQAKI
jgi:hypothetical protein